MLLIKNFKLFFLFLFLASCGIESDVKKTPFNACPDKTIEQVFKKNFTNHKWSSFNRDKRDFVKYEGIHTSTKGEKNPVVYLFAKNQLNVWSTRQILMGGNDVTIIFLASPQVNLEMCKK